MKSIPFRGGIMHVNESKADCPFCTKHITFDRAMEAFEQSNDDVTLLECDGCHRDVGIAQTITGDIVSFNPKDAEQ